MTFTPFENCKKWAIMDKELYNEISLQLDGLIETVQDFMAGMDHECEHQRELYECFNSVEDLLEIGAKNLRLAGKKVKE